jgi:3,4-dihydroxy 2-butanone 4-phosphate synthase/GTP cyclohydrolase II
MDFLEKFLGSQATINSRTWGKLTIESVSFTPATDGDLVVIIGQPFEQEKPLIRIHSECVFAEVFDSDLCDCADQFKLAMKRLTDNEHGLLFYLRFDGRGAGLAAKVKATALEVAGMDTYDSRVHIGVAPEGRDFGNIGEYLKNHGVNKARLLTNNPIKGKALEQVGLTLEYEPLIVDNPNENVRKLYSTKAEKFNHTISKKFR